MDNFDLSMRKRMDRGILMPGALHHEESIAVLRERFSAAIKTPIPSMDYSFIGTRQGKRLKVEVTARVST